jgi:hypothetical protein
VLTEGVLALPMLYFYIRSGRLDDVLQLFDTMLHVNRSKKIVAPMIRRLPTKYVALLFLFTFCQVIGSMCTWSDLSMAEDATAMVEEHMTCPMDGTIVCPPSLISSPERQFKQSIIFMDVAHAPIVLSPDAVLTVFSASTQRSRSSVCSIVPLSIDSSPVLRI